MQQFGLLTGVLQAAQPFIEMQVLYMLFVHLLSTFRLQTGVIGHWQLVAPPIV